MHIPIEVLPDPSLQNYMSLHARVDHAGGLGGGGGRGNCPPSLKPESTWFSDCFISQGVGLTLWLVLALHRGLHCSFSSIATVVKFIYNEYIHDCGMS